MTGEGSGIDHVVRHPPTADPASWWQRYADSLGRSGIQEVSRSVIELDSRYILEHGVLGTGPAGSEGWPDGRVRRGVVMGAVQSGKTASMLGVAALSFDAGVDMVVVLAGTRVSLWRQSLDRLTQQLDAPEADSPTARAKRRLMVPDASLAMSEEPTSTSRFYTVNGPTMRRALRDGRPVIAVVLKHAQHLRELSKLIRNRVLPALDGANRPFHMLVLDDEADDGSILDARIEQPVDPALQDLKQIPRAIVDLWETRPHNGQTMSPLLYATYIGYTATPQANFLQSDHNPLAPTDFAIALRTPGDQGELSPRSSSYREPAGLGGHYTGGETFYHRLPPASLCRTTTASPRDDLRHALRAFLIAGAIRLWRDDRQRRPSVARATRFATRRDASSGSPKPHSMLFHPSPTIDDHFSAAASVLEVLCGMDQATARRRIDAGERTLPRDAVEQALGDDESAWLQVLSDYEVSASAVAACFDLPRPRPIPAAADWPAVRQLICDEVVPETRIKVVNSDPRADDRPLFDPVEDADGWAAPPDLSTIFVSGNVMSRGLTLEGLTTTLFLRHSDDPFADTQMQMQRWFGYRGATIELCRVFMPSAQLDLFRAYHDADEALRRTVLGAMNDETDRAPTPVVLQGRDFSATGKLTNVGNVPLCPGATPFVRLVNSGEESDPNLALVARTFASGASEDVVANNVLRGRLLSEPLPLAEAATLLDGMTYADYRPPRDGWEGSRWLDLPAKVGIGGDDAEGLLPFFRAPRVARDHETAYLRGGPYAISAYLRLWAACLTRRARGLVATDDARVPWSMLDLRQKDREQPRFYVGIRYGSGARVTDAGVDELPFEVTAMRRMVLGNALVGGWGTRNPSEGPDQYLGDELFDYHYHRATTPPKGGPGEPRWRPKGAPGLILFHVIERDDRPFPVVAVGVAIPLGGPDQFAAREPDAS